MEPFGRAFSLAVMTILAMPIYSEKTYVYFSDFDNCARTYTVDRDDVIVVAGKRTTDTSSSAFTDCSLLFRAGSLEDTLCVKISTLTFNNNKLQLQYFGSLDPSVGTPAGVFDSNSPANTPLEICSNQYEISMKLHNLDGVARIEDVEVIITIFNMQGAQRKAYMDEDCANTFKLRDSTVYVQNSNAIGAMAKVSLCQLVFEYIGTNPNKTVCLQYMRLKDDVCDYSLKVFDGSRSGYTLAHTYTCSQTTPQIWCSTRTTIQLELVNSGQTALPENTFSIEVKDAASVDGNWSNWGSWAECSLSCGAGEKTRSRQCNNPPPYGGSPCPGDSTDQATCDKGICPGKHVAGNWSNWGSWTECSVSCGAGEKSRSRQCNSPPPYGGSPCPGDSTDQATCDKGICPGKHVAGNWSNWGSWTECSVSCGAGEKSRSRQCNSPPPYGGSPCPGDSTDQATCDKGICPGKHVAGNWSNWGSWTECSVSCGAGEKSRSRQCNSPPPYGGSPCPGDSTEQASCNEGICLKSSSALSFINGSQQSVLNLLIVLVVTYLLIWRP